jgi:hypothetical protein
LNLEEQNTEMVEYLKTQFNPQALLDRWMEQRGYERIIPPQTLKHERDS